MITSAIRRNIPRNILREDILNKISPLLFDVSLRDGLQGADPTDWPTSKKQKTFDFIRLNYKPYAMEIGSLASPKILPIMGDTKEMYKHATRMVFDNDNPYIHPRPKPYILIPSLSKLQVAINNKMHHLSFITSVSNMFQLKNTNMTLPQVKSQFNQLFEQLNGEPDPTIYVKKLYISCINHCPIVGKLDNDEVVKEILYYQSNYDFDELCLSDTCGSLLANDFEYIVETIRIFGVPLSKISLHLHVSDSNMENLERILRYCFRNGIRRFDVSMMESGGCSVTMNRDKLLANLSYEQFYYVLNKHINAVIENNLEN
jgi:hypothetical protein